MADKTETVISLTTPGATTGWGVYTAEVINLDTVTIGNFTTILNSIMIDLTDNAVITHTRATNVLTLADVTVVALINVMIFVQGA